MARPHRIAGNAGKGRKPGVPNKATAEIRAAARRYTIEAIEALASVMQDPAAPAAARVSAATALLDRGHGRPGQQVDAHLTIEDISDDELSALLAAIREARGAG